MHASRMHWPWRTTKVGDQVVLLIIHHPGASRPVLVWNLATALICLLPALVLPTPRCSPPFQILNEPLAQLASVAVLLLFPISLIPYPLVWLYDKVLWLSEPGLQVLEVVLAIQCILKLGQGLVDHIDDQPTLAKVGKIYFCELSQRVL